MESIIFLISQVKQKLIKEPILITRKIKTAVA